MIAAALDPGHYGWWLASRAAAIVALILMVLSVLLGLTMATKVLRRPRLTKLLAGLHEHASLAALVAIAVHGLALLGDRWLHPSLAQIALPFAMPYRPLWTGLGVIGGYLTAVLALSFYARKRFGSSRWRFAHRFTLVGYALGVVHALGAGTDAGTTWFQVVALAPLVPILGLLSLRFLPQRSPAPATGR